MQKQNYRIDILNYSDNDSVKSNCADITFFNNGLDPVLINGALRLISGQSFTITANSGEIDHTIYRFQFENTGAIKAFTVFRKIYI